MKTIDEAFLTYLGAGSGLPLVPQAPAPSFPRRVIESFRGGHWRRDPLTVVLLLVGLLALTGIVGMLTGWPKDISTHGAWKPGIFLTESTFCDPVSGSCDVYQSRSWTPWTGAKPKAPIREHHVSIDFTTRTYL